jgi:hypothetical protein
MKLSGLFDRVYVVSLISSNDRRKHIVEQFDQIGIVDYEFHDAVGHNDPVVTEFYETNRVALYPPCFRCGKADCGNPECNNTLIPQQVAVFITYLRLWEKVAARKERALISNTAKARNSRSPQTRECPIPAMPLHRPMQRRFSSSSKR